jgi:predicted PurR-regulated permease PerM
MRTRVHRNAAADALGVLSTLALAAFVITLLAVAREILMPLALAALLTFLLSPLATRLERAIGRVAAVIVVVTMIFAATGAAGWMVTRQLIDVATKLPDYKENIVAKVHAIQLPRNLSALSRTLEEVRRELPGATPPAAQVESRSNPSASAAPTVDPPGAVARVEVVATPGETAMGLIRSVIGPLMGPIGTAALVMLLVFFMLLQRDDLRRRVIRLVGQGHISATTRALDEAGQRVSRYLLMQLVINVSYGVPVGLGLWFIGLPNAFLWGGLATVLRFVPYVGPWVAASFPIVLSLAVSPDWTMPAQTIALFVALELLSNNLMEPWLYGASTGVTSIAVIVAAVFWTWLWGPMGLVLSTPLTVCLVVLGRHVPRLSFLSVILSDEEALTPAEDLYQRILTPGEHDEMDLVEQYLANGSVLELYDFVLIPALLAAETDARQGQVDPDQLAAVHQSLRDIVQELGTRADTDAPLRMEPDAPAREVAGHDREPAIERGGSVQTAAKDAPVAPLPRPRVLCLPVRGERDELAASMLAHVLQARGCEAWFAPLPPLRTASGELVELVGKSEADIVVISVVPPSSVIHARYICLRLRSQFPDLRVVVGLWGFGDRLQSASRRLRDAGACAVAPSVADAANQVVEHFSRQGEQAEPPLSLVSSR